MDTKDNKKHVVYSRGVTLSGFDLPEVTVKLSTLLKKPESTISKRLLSGTTKKIKSFEQLSDAEKLVKVLSKLGLDCYTSLSDIEDFSRKNSI